MTIKIPDPNSADFGGKMFAGVRADVLAREQAGKRDPETGNYEIIIRF